MNELPTDKLDELLEKTVPGDFRKYSESISPLPSISGYLNEYIGKKRLSIPKIIRASLLSKDYAYAILNGNRKNPAKDKLIALCLAMHMNLLETQRALKICNMVLYSKNNRDAAIIICINNQIFDIDRVNDFLLENKLPVLETSKS